MKFNIGLYTRFINYCIKQLKMTKEEAKLCYYNTTNQTMKVSLERIIQQTDPVAGMFLFYESPEGSNFWFEIDNRTRYPNR